MLSDLNTQVCVLYTCCLEIHVAATTDANIKEVSSLNCWELILAGIRRHSSVPELVTNGCLALAAIVEADGNILTANFVYNLIF